MKMLLYYRKVLPIGAYLLFSASETNDVHYFVDLGWLCEYLATVK